jgi:DNA-binding response OmpR family regulator
MVAGNTEETALGTARGRFVESLPSRAVELEGAIAQLHETPSAEAPRNDMRRRLQALYASALMFRSEALSEAIHEGLELLDDAHASGRALDESDLALLSSLVKRLPELSGETRDVPAMAPTNGERELALSQASFVPGSARTASSRPPAASPSNATSPERRLRDPLFSRVLHVLVLPMRAEQGELGELLRSASVRVSTVSNVEAALAFVQQDTPDLVLANERLARTGELVALLRGDSNTDFVPLVLYEGAEGTLASVPSRDEADGFVPRPFSSEQLLRTIGGATGTLIEPSGPAQVGDVTVEELVERVADELRRTLIESTVRGRRERVSFGTGGEILATTYTAVAALRSAIAHQSGGRVQFADRAPSGPTLVSGDSDESPIGDQLQGRRVILAEDDTAVVLLLANELRERGATVNQFTDGPEARDAARRERPDLVIAGARLPNLDGFSLARSLAHDPLLCDVPVLLLPAKDQLLTRGREPSAVTQLNADVAQQVLRSAALLLQPRTELEQKLRQPGELCGSLDGTGVIALLRSVRRLRPDTRVRIRDAWNLFECELRDGRLAQLTRTASDGSFVRNERALPQLLGTTAGRFSVVASEGPMKVSFEGTLDEVLTRGARELLGELDAVSGDRLARVARIVFDEDAYALLMQETPPAVRQVIERLYAGESPVKLLKSGIAELHTLEPMLLDMARRGALRGVVGSAGEDLVSEARSAHLREQPIELASPLSLVPPPPNPVISMLPSSGPLEDQGPVKFERAPAPASEAVPADAAGETMRERAVPSSAPPRAPVPDAVTRAREASAADASEVAAAAAEDRRSRGTLAAWALALLALAAVGFFFAREEDGSAAPEALGGSPLSVGAGKPAGEELLPARHKGGSLISAEDNGFAVYDGILERGLTVPQGHALLVVEATPALADALVFVNDRELGQPPQSLSLPEGVHELAIKRGDAISYRFVSVHPGRTWVLRSP